jgi:hypothetical protein
MYKITARYLVENGFSLVENTQVFECLEMPYYVKNGIILFFNTPVTEWNENSFLFGIGEMRCGKYHCTVLRWITEVDELRSLFTVITNKNS